MWYQLLVWVLVVVWAGVGAKFSANTCPCALVPASDSYPGGGAGNFKWNCRDRLLPEVPIGCWAENPNVTQVDLFNNHITTLRPGDFEGLWNLRFLNTYKSYLSTVEAGSLRGITSLVYLDLGFGFLTEVPEEVSFMPQLEVLALEYNEITRVPQDFILPLVNLRQLIFVRNQIEMLPELWFLPHLTWLDLEANNLKSLPHELLGDLKEPCGLWINDNPLSDVGASTLMPLPDGSEIRTNSSVRFWAKDEAAKQELLMNNWRVYDKNQQELNIEVLTHTCDEYYEPPTDFIHPCEYE